MMNDKELVEKCLLPESIMFPLLNEVSRIIMNENGLTHSEALEQGRKVLTEAIPIIRKGEKERDRMKIKVNRGAVKEILKPLEIFKVDIDIYAAKILSLIQPLVDRAVKERMRDITEHYKCKAECEVLNKILHAYPEVKLDLYLKTTTPQALQESEKRQHQKNKWGSSP